MDRFLAISDLNYMKALQANWMSLEYPKKAIFLVFVPQITSSFKNSTPH